MAPVVWGAKETDKLISWLEPPKLKNVIAESEAAAGAALTVAEAYLAPVLDVIEFGIMFGLNVTFPKITDGIEDCVEDVGVITDLVKGKLCAT